MKFSRAKFKRVRPLLGTYVEIELRARASTKTLHRWITTGFEAIVEIDRLMSSYKPDSDLSRLNQAQPNVWIPIHPHTAKVLRASNQFYRASHGAFDIRCAGQTRTSFLPIKIAGDKKILRACKTGSWTMDLDGIAKGYAVDCAVRQITSLGGSRLLSGIVNAGGDLRRWGKETASVAVATSTVRTAKNSETLSPACHRYMPSGKILREEKTVSVLSGRCLWSDALTKIMLLAPKDVAMRCLSQYHAHGIVLS